MTGGDPERIYQAKRADIFTRLTQGERVNELDAEHWISRWERHADKEGLSRTFAGYWDVAWLWIAEQRAPKLDASDESDEIRAKRLSAEQP